MSESTVRRWRGELIGLLAAQAPRLDRALMKVAKQGGEVVLSTAPSYATSAAPGGPTGGTMPQGGRGQPAAVSTEIATPGRWHQR
ncbi:hypothetical protein OG864_53565 [Streptomyces sp. NBC_00124]|uniref:hypothetical protein n=1 Tax=Streptomyces sp. NBC_00124 TaxID=2975662 RepID=UPI00225411AB|nr:hypothetical protein [Streptomyces sp. NBC_00124]MCX5367480.1 hypothetical protein [Streptomyces sp. NBC_00124]